MKDSDIMLLSSLRANARDTLTNISKKIKVPVSTIFDRLKLHEKGLIQKHTSIIDFSKLGFSTRANIILKVNKDDKEELRKFLLGNWNINSVVRINNGYDFLAEAVFKNILELEQFCEILDERFRIKSKQIFYIIEDLKREEFLANPTLAAMVI
ncbi:Lrp/AsnC family transcriptional regulator [Candidatus Woesearchaeota archaeon]|nr:Lrp/AsnC family transcriptional regulator [Candidatus Woesearchaeota archaeon]